MLISKDQEVRPEYQEGSQLASAGGPSGVSEPPPPFQDTERHGAIDIDSNDETYAPEGGEEPPPDFTPYEAEFMVSGTGNIVSHDPHLNQDGEALYRFLLSQANTPPTYQLHCRGTHQETRTRFVSDSDGQSQSRNRTETETITVTDFDFYVDVGRNIVSGPVHWSVGDSEPAYRGTMVKQVDLPDGRRNATRKEIKSAETWQKERSGKGLPPWVGQDWFNRPGPDGPHDGTVLKSSKTLRQWADEYCASPKDLKEFEYKKVIYGWNIQALTDATRAAIKSTGYHGSLSVGFETTVDRIYIRPDNGLSRVLSNKWLKFLLVITLIYPFIWLFKRFHSRGGGRWVVCGGAYALKCYQPISDNDGQFPNTTGFGDPSILKTTVTAETVAPGGGLLRLVGVREGEWFHDWEGAIRSAVISRLQSKAPMTHPGTRPYNNPAALMLDGY